MAKQLVVRLDDNTYDAMHRYAEDTERTASQVVRFALKRLFESPSELIVMRPAIPIADDLPEEIQPPPSIPRPKRTGMSAVQAILKRYEEEAS